MAKVDNSGTSRTANIGDQVRQRSHQHFNEWQTGDGSTVLFFLQRTPSRDENLIVTVNGARFRPKDRATAHDYELSGNQVTFTVAPANGHDICFEIIS